MKNSVGPKLFLPLRRLFLQRSLFPAGTVTDAAHGAQSFTVPRP